VTRRGGRSAGWALLAGVVLLATDTIATLVGAGAYFLAGLASVATVGALLASALVALAPFGDD
jgi:hypothetical protein